MAKAQVKSTTRVFVQKDGVVIHSHPGIAGLHGPWVGHKGDLHGVAVAGAPLNLDELTADQKVQYAAALKGKDFSYLWVAGTAARKAAKVAAGGSWKYGKPVAAE